MYSRTVSTPYCRTTSWGSRPLCLDLLIFSKVTSTRPPPQATGSLPGRDRTQKLAAVEESRLGKLWKKSSRLSLNDQNNVFSQEQSGFMLCVEFHNINTGFSSTIYSGGKWDLHKNKLSMSITQKSRGFNLSVTIAFPIDHIYLSNKARLKIFDHRDSYERQSLAVIWKNL